MKIKINGESKKLPGSWDELTFRDFLKLAKCNTEGDQLAALMGIQPDTLRKAKISNLEDILRYISFLSTPMPNYVPSAILGYAVPQDLQFQEVGRFEDVKSIAQSFKRVDDGLADGELEKYTEIVTVFAMPNYLDATPEEQKKFAEQFMDAPCWEVMAVGNFTLVKLADLIQRRTRKSHALSTVLNNFKQATIRLLKRTGFSRR